MERIQSANPFNKIGFHIDSDPDFNSRRLYDWVWQLNNAGIPVFLKSVDNYRPFQEALEWVEGSDVPHTFLYRIYANHSGSKTPYNFDEPNYELNPKEAANQHWQAILANLPPDFDPAQVWLEVLHEPNESYADWLGFFALEISQMALEQGFRLALFGWGNRQPSREAWYQGGLVEFLHLCQERPNQLAISLHEYSHDCESLFEADDSGIGYFQELTAASQDKEMSPPTIFISEWGWKQDEIPDPELALAHIQQVGQLYARFPEVQGAALWTLGGQENSRISDAVEQLIQPLTDFSLNVRFDLEEGTAVPAAENSYGANGTPDISGTPDSSAQNNYDTSPGSLTIPDYSAQFLADVAIPDGTELEPGSSFVKKWRVRNNGRLPWNDDCQLLYSGGADFTGIPSLSDTTNLTVVSIPFPHISPGAEGEIQMELVAPIDPGTYQLTFVLVDPNGNPFHGDDQLASNIVVTDQPGVPDYDARFLNHVTIAEGAELLPGRFFDKAWRVRNDGRLPWNPDFQIVQQDNTQLGETLSHPLFEKAEDRTPPPAIAPGELTTLRISLTSPLYDGSYTAEWRLQNDQGDFFGDPLRLAITVLPDPDIAQAADTPSGNVYDEDPAFEDVSATGDDENALVRQVVDYSNLRRLLAQAFNLEEFEDIAFELGIDPDEIGGETRQDKVRGLINYTDRRNLLPELLKVVSQQRPNINWPYYELSYPQLRRQLTDAFNLSDIQDICFDLGITFEDIPGSGKQEKIIGLVQAIERQDRLLDLINIVQRERPNIAWAKNPYAETDSPQEGDILSPTTEAHVPLGEDASIDLPPGLFDASQSSIQQASEPETKGEDILFGLDEAETIDEPEPREPAVWFYIGSGDSQQQMDYLAQAPEVTWAANKNSKQDDLILMYRDGPFQDFAYLFHALDDAHEQDMNSAPSGWDEKWTHAIHLGQKQTLDNPVSRHLLKTHPDLRNWRPISHSPQGIMKRTQGLNQGIGGEARWQAIRGLLVGWNPDAADYLAKFDQSTTHAILEGAITAVSALPDIESRREGLQNISQFLGRMTEFADLQQTLSQDTDWQVKKEALRRMGKEEPTDDDILREANSLINRQRFQKTINFLENEAPEWQKSKNNDDQAKAHRLLGEAYQKVGQTESALSHWQQAARLDPSDITTFDKIGRHTPAEKRDEAEKFMAEMGSEADKAAGPLAGQAALAEKVGQPEKAAAFLKEAKATAKPEQKREIEVIERRVIQYLPQPETAVTFPPTHDDPIIHERKQKLFKILREHFNTGEIEQLCFEIENVKYENIPGKILNEKAFGLVEHMDRLGRLVELVELIKSKRPDFAHLFQETAADIIAAARALLRQQQPQQAIATLQDKAAIWQLINDQTVRADAHAILAQAYEATGQTDLAHAQWKLKAPLTPNAIDAYRGLVRTAVKSELDELEQWLREIRHSQPTAVGPLTGLATLLSRQKKPDEAAKLLAEANTGNPTQDRAFLRTAEALKANPEKAAETLAGTAVTPAPFNPDSNRLTEAMTDLAAIHSPLNADDQVSVFSEIVQQIISLPTLSPAHKREFGDRANRILAEVRQTGQFTPQHAANLRLPVLDNLFITDPPRRRALVHAAAAYRQQTTRRLCLYLRHRARKQMRQHLAEAHVTPLQTNNGADHKQAFADLQTAVFKAGAVNNILLKNWLAENKGNGRALRQWRKADLTITGNLCHDLPDHLLEPFPTDDPAIWQAIFDLRYSQSPLYQRQDSWGRLALSTMDDQMSSLILYAFEPDEHLPYHPDTAVAALKNLELTDRAQNLNYPDFVAFARQLLQDGDLGFASLDDVACFLTQIADDEDKNVIFAPGDAPAHYGDLLPPLTDHLLMPVNDFDTPLTLSDSTFSQMAHALSAGNHIILIGPPGTGKTSIALDICSLAHDLNASRGAIAVTATADWTTFDTVGGYMPNDDGRLTFREGILLRAIREGKWVIIDEINRAEIDKAFGELFTVLSGQPITLPYRDGSAPIRIVPADFPGKTARDYVIPPGWRIIGTMNVFDKASLFEMSSAFMRRFAFVDVGIPRPNEVFMGLIDRWLAEFELPTIAEDPIVTAIKTHIFAEDSDIMQHRQLGPAIARDIIRYISQCRKQGEPVSLQHVGEAFLLYAIPQFDGLDEPTVITVHKHLQTTFAQTDALNEIHRRMQDLFPQYELELVEAVSVDEPIEET